VSADETSFLRDIEKLIGNKLPVEVLEGFEPDPNASTQPIKQGQGRQNRNSRPSNRSGNSSKSSSKTSSSRRPKRNSDRRN